MPQEGKLKDRDLVIIISAFIAIVGFIAVLKYWDLSPKGLKFTDDLCLKEINKKYITASKESETFYKVEKIEGKLYHLKAYRNGHWTFIGTRPLSYFKEGDIFKFENDTCPDVISREVEKEKSSYDSFQFSPKKK